MFPHSTIWNGLFRALYHPASSCLCDILGLHSICILRERERAAEFLRYFRIQAIFLMWNCNRLKLIESSSMWEDICSLFSLAVIYFCKNMRFISVIRGSILSQDDILSILKIICFCKNMRRLYIFSYKNIRLIYLYWYTYINKIEIRYKKGLSADKKKLIFKPFQIILHVSVFFLWIIFSRSTNRKFGGRKKGNVQNN